MIWSEVSLICFTRKREVDKGEDEEENKTCEQEPFNKLTPREGYKENGRGKDEERVIKGIAEGR